MADSNENKVLVYVIEYIKKDGSISYGTFRCASGTEATEWSRRVKESNPDIDEIRFHLTTTE